MFFVPFKMALCLLFINGLSLVVWYLVGLGTEWIPGGYRVDTLWIAYGYYVVSV